MNKKISSNDYNNYYNINQNNLFIQNIIPKGKVQNLPKKTFQYLQSQKKSMPANYRNFNNNVYNDNINNTYDGLKIKDRNFSGLQNDYNYGNHRVLNSNDFNDKKRTNKEEEIQGRFDHLQNKINQLQNLLSKIGPKSDMTNNDINKRLSYEYKIDSNPININKNNNYKPSTYNPKFYPNNNIIKNNNNNNNINARKELNRIHNQMQTKNPKASLIKKMTQFHINDNNLNNNNKNQDFTRKIINNNKFMTNQKNKNNNNYNFINNNSNYNNNFNQINLRNANKLTNFDINKYPHEIQQIQEIDNLNINLNNNKFIGNNNYFAQYNNNQYNNVNNMNNYNQFSKFNNINNINNINKNFMNNLNNNNPNKFNNNNENDDDNSNSDILSDLAEDLLEYKTDLGQKDKQKGNNININNNNYENINIQAKLNNNNNNQLNYQNNNDMNYKNISNDEKNIFNDNMKMSLMYNDNDNEDEKQFTNLSEIDLNNNNDNIYIPNNQNINNNININNIKSEEINKEKSNENINNINNLGNCYIENSVENSLSKNVKTELMQQLNIINNTQGIKMNQKYIFVDQKNSNNTNDNNSKLLNKNINDKKDVDININNINYQQNQISNSNIIFNVSYSRDANPILIEPDIEKSLQIQNKIEEQNANKKINSPKIEVKPNRRIEIKLDRNLCYEYHKDSLLEDYCLVYNNGNKEQKKIFMDEDQYMKKLKGSLTPKPCIKKFDEKSIKFNDKYALAENLREEEIIPDLYEEDDEDIKSLKQSLEKSIDKIFTHSLNENLSEQFNDNSNNTGRNIINKLQNMIIEDINEDYEDKGDNYTYEEDDEEQNEQNEQNELYEQNENVMKIDNNKNN